MKTVIVGASLNPQRFANQAAAPLKHYGYEFIPLGIKSGLVSGQPIQNIRQFPAVNKPHTITLYIRPELQKQYYDYLLGLKPERIIFNPGAENPEFAKQATDRAIETIDACTLVMLKTGQF